MILEKLFEEITRFRTNSDARPITSEVTPDEIQEHLLSRYDFSRAVDLEQILDDVSQMLRRWSEHSTHPRHFGLFTPTTELSGVLADALVALYNPQLATWEMAPAANEIERFTLARLGEKFGYDSQTSSANFTSGGNEANHTAVVLALTRHFPEYGGHGVRGLRGRPVFYLSQEGHHSFEKVAHSTGLGRSALRYIPADESLRMDTEALVSAIEKDLEMGNAPFMVAGTAGTTNAGVIDPLPRLAEICRDFGLWFHVDAAWGGAAALSENLAVYLQGIQDSDSITFDAHKWLSVPNGAGMVFCRHKGLARAAFYAETDYVPDRHDDGRPYPFADTMQWSRRFIGLKVFTRLAERGMPGIARDIDQQTRLGNYFRGRIAALGWKILNRTPLPVVCFMHPRIEAGRISTAEVVRRITLGQIGYITKTMLRGVTPALRMCVTNLETREEDVDRLVEGLEEVVAGNSELGTADPELVAQNS